MRPKNLVYLSAFPFLWACSPGQSPEAKKPSSDKPLAVGIEPSPEEPRAAEKDALALVQDPLCPSSPQELNLDDIQVTLVPGVVNHFDGFGNIEGPVWLGGALYYSNISGGTNPPPSVIWKLIPGQTPVIHAKDTGSNGLGVTHQGDLLLAQHSTGTVAQGSGSQLTSLKPLAQAPVGARFNSPNDLVLSRSGRLYFTDPTWQAPSPMPQAEPRFYLVKDGVARALGEVNAPQNPNGITLGPDETHLYVGGQNGLFRYEISASGDVKVPGENLSSPDLKKDAGIDGLGRDCSGNIYVTVHSEKKVVILNSEGHQVGAIAVPSAGGVTNVAFGGEKRSTLYITSLGQPPQIHSAELNVVGHPY